MSNQSNQVIIREAAPEDAEQISNLIVEVAEAQLRPEFTDDGWELFLRLISRQTQKGLIVDEHFRYWVATRIIDGQEQIIGMLSSKNIFHVFHFFILPGFQKVGVGRALWRNFLFHLPEQSETIITVKSSNYALGFYKKLGFTPQQPRCVKNGLAYTLMHYFHKVGVR